MGAGFAFVGRQYKVQLSEKERYIDLLFYQLKSDLPSIEDIENELSNNEIKK